jgi:FKBP-type peptidyl-prolyl cis-trans isomerase SlpA
MNANVHADSYLTLHYRITLMSGPGAGTVFIDTFSGKPGTLQMNAGQWSPSMESPLLGHAEGESFSYDLPAQAAYGERNPELLQRVTRQMLARDAGEDAEFEPGDMVAFTAPNGGRYSGIFRQWEEDLALFDFNHPLAGVDLRIDVKLLGVL